jgi:hypothetical protein
MDTAQVGKQLVELCRKGEFHTCLETLYGKNVVSVEPMAMNNMPAEAKGIQAVLAKNKWFMDNHTIHSAKVHGPFVARNQFIVQFEMDVTDKPTGKRAPMAEAGIYTVEDGKIVREEFFYGG